MRKRDFWIWLSRGPANVVDGLCATITLGFWDPGLSSACYYKSLDYKEEIPFPMTFIHDEGPEPEMDDEP